ncbi:uncharacterized protein LOC120351018 [Nilaparvata lugens]|uniref:uncharacterized protein LOC120351018 n=1 Tax=Nilaparvata lugens TaxID=108931 RepID=UPI00193EBA6F|nr:uncharacterized protein LOC120351018 [Nilaparvata lugens]
MANTFHGKNPGGVFLTMSGHYLGLRSCELIKKLEENPEIDSFSLQALGSYCIQNVMHGLKNSQVKTLSFHACFMGNDGAQILAKDLQLTNITFLDISNNQIRGDNATYLSDIVQNTSINYLDISWNFLRDEGIKYLAKGLKNSNVITLNLGNNRTSHGIKYLVDVLPYTKITRLDLNEHYESAGNFNEIGDEGAEYLSKQLEYTNISHLNLERNGITNYGVKCLSEHLERTCLTFLGLKFNFDLDESATRYLRPILSKTQITGITYPYINEDTRIYMNKFNSSLYPSPNKTRQSKINEMILKLVAQNPHTHDLEFIIPDRIQDIDLSEYVYIIKQFNEKPMIRGYMFDLIRKNNCESYPQIIEKVNEFVTSIHKKSIDLIENMLLRLMEYSNNNDFVYIVREFEYAELGEIVQHLLLHRVLYYVDEDAEILHPFIYKMLIKYGMPLYNEQIEPDKKEKIIAFFESHREIEEAPEIIHLLKTKS